MTIIDSESKRPDPVEEVVRVMAGTTDIDGDRLDTLLIESEFRKVAQAVLSRLNKLGMLSEAYYEAIAEKRK